jgi:hypothetical protein
MDGHLLRRLRAARGVRLLAVDAVEELASVVAAEAVAVHGVELGHPEPLLAPGIVLVQMGTSVAEGWIGCGRHGWAMDARSA